MDIIELTTDIAEFKIEIKLLKDCLKNKINNIGASINNNIVI